MEDLLFREPRTEQKVCLTRCNMFSNRFTNRKLLVLLLKVPVTQKKISNRNIKWRARSFPVAKSHFTKSDDRSSTASAIFQLIALPKMLLFQFLCRQLMPIRRPAGIPLRAIELSGYNWRSIPFQKCRPSIIILLFSLREANTRIFKRKRRNKRWKKKERILRA